MLIIVLLGFYWFITMMIQLGISAASEDSENPNIPVIFLEALFLGWIFVPIFIGEALGLYVYKAIKERYS